MSGKENIGKQEGLIRRPGDPDEILRLQNMIHEYAEKIANVGSWTWNPVTNEAFYSDNMFRLFGLEPNEVEPSFETIPQYIHPEDRPRLLEAAQTVKDGEEPVTSEYRVIRKDGVLRIFQNKLKYLTNSARQKILVGITEDITDRRKAEQELKALNRSLVKKNKELQQRNADIAAFSSVAGHDLKEPLRKIYFLIEQLLTKEQDALSDEGKGLFKKVQSLAQRMNLLTDDILAFAQLNDRKKKLTKVDLNEVLKQAMEQHSDAISNSRTRIDAEQLPVITAYEEVMQILFKNMLGNAIKFRSERDPHIIIRSQQLQGKDIKHPDAALDQDYLKLSFIDNGMGFDMQYAELVFKMFKRLNSGEHYPGTGIGLTLCMKAAQLHNGSIAVESKPGVGTEFHCYIQLDLKR